MIKILIADDHAVVRKGLKQIISEASDMVVTDEASTGQEALRKIWKNDFDVVILDISMPDMNGLDILKQIKNAKSDLPVLIFSVHSEERYALRFMRSGASGYLTKEKAPEELIEAIRKINLGKKYVASSLGEKLAFAIDADKMESPHEALSDREYQVMVMIAEGRTTKEISEELFLSAKTISTYRSRVLKKMNMKNNAEIIYYSIKKGLID